MTESFTDNGALGTWSADPCPFAIEYSRKALDDIRLAVVDAFFSLPRGGAEIGGILLGKVDEHRIQILDYAPIECEHAFGPAFTLSPADQVRLGDTLSQPFPGELRPVGWYHSHTRSEISLSESDLDIHNRYFPERWQVALVLRPSTLQPTLAGFFFREPDGSIHAESSYHEFVVEALSLQPMTAGSPQAVPGPMRETEPDAVVMTMPAPPETTLLLPPPGGAQISEAVSHVLEPPNESMVADVRELEHRTEPEHEPVVRAALPVEEPAPAPFESHWEPPHTHQLELEEMDAEPENAPSFLMHDEEEPKAKRGWIGIAAGIIAGVAIGVAGDQMRPHPQPAANIAPAVVAAARPAPAPESAALRKQNNDLARQVANLTQQNANLRKENADLGKQQAESSKQQTELSKQQGESGKMQAELRQQRDDLAKQTAKLKADLSAQTARAQWLQQQLEELRRQQQRRRLSIQSSDPLP